MIIDTYDLAGSFLASRYEEKSDWDVHRKPLTSREVPQLLICPDDAHAGNRLPYLQDKKNPSIVDFFDAEGLLNFDSAHWIRDILEEIKEVLKELKEVKPYDKEDKRSDILERLKVYLSLLSAYFHALLASSASHDKKVSVDWNILVIPDSYSATKQEYILRRCTFPRSQTRLLWRSVSICLGLMDELIAAGAKEGADVAILDIVDDGYSVSILKLANDDGQLVPQRSAFSSRNTAYLEKYGENYAESRTCDSEEGNLFYKNTYKDGVDRALVYANGRFIEKAFERSGKQPFVLADEMLHASSFCIVRGAARVEFINESSLKRPRLIMADDDAACLGAARFALRSDKKLPTYFDECEALSIILQNTREQKILTKTLIYANSRCRGGEEIIGDTYDKSILPAESDTAQFYLLSGGVDPKKKLKELKHQFKQMTSDAQLLTLYPSMIPGQGIAVVEVDGAPLLKERVRLELLEMKKSEETLDSLTKEMKKNLAYPVDYPEIEALEKHWKKAKKGIDDYLEYGKIDSGLFAKSDYKDRLALGIKALERTNVFGSSRSSRKPIDDVTLDKLFFLMLRDYEQCQKKNDKDRIDDIVRMAAWTYQAHHICIKKISTSCLDYIISRLKVDKSFRPQYHTMMAYCLPSHNERKQYIKEFLKHAKKRIVCCRINIDIGDEAPYVSSARFFTKNLSEIDKVDRWLEALSKMFMNYNNLFECIEENDCRLLVDYLIIILASYITNGKGERYINPILYSLLFMLKRRRYYPDFMLKDSQHAKAIRHWVGRNQDLPEGKKLLKFLDGKGSIQDLPALI